MARPDIKESRREQIIDAFEFCVARYGVEGATLAKTAEQAGLARPLVRHNVGNRDDLVDALTKR
ncbi:MAG: TetR/AcrR family transcriptional regulator, partial [Pseudomonadota bacterium]